MSSYNFQPSKTLNNNMLDVSYSKPSDNFKDHSDHKVYERRKVL